MFDDLTGESEGAVNYDMTSEFESGGGREKLEEFLNYTRDVLNVPVIVMVCVSHDEVVSGGEHTGAAGMMVATHARNEKGRKWYPGLMELVMGLLSQPTMLHAIEKLLPFIKHMSESEDEVEVRHERGGKKELRDFFDNISEDIPDWLDDLLGDDDDEEDE